MDARGLTDSSTDDEEKWLSDMSVSTHESVNAYIDGLGQEEERAVADNLLAIDLEGNLQISDSSDDGDGAIRRSRTPTNVSDGSSTTDALAAKNSQEEVKPAEKGQAEDGKSSSSSSDESSSSSSSSDESTNDEIPNEQAPPNYTSDSSASVQVTINQEEINKSVQGILASARPQGWHRPMPRPVMRSLPDSFSPLDAYTARPRASLPLPVIVRSSKLCNVSSVTDQELSLANTGTSKSSQDGHNVAPGSSRSEAAGASGTSQAEPVNVSGSSPAKLVNVSGPSSAEPVNVSGPSSAEHVDVSGPSSADPVDVSGSSLPKPVDVSGSSPPKPVDVSGSSPPKPVNVSGSSPPKTVDVSGSSSPKPVDMKGSPAKPVDTLGSSPAEPVDTLGSSPAEPVLAMESSEPSPSVLSLESTQPRAATTSQSSESQPGPSNDGARGKNRLARKNKKKPDVDSVDAGSNEAPKLIPPLSNKTPRKNRTPKSSSKEKQPPKPRKRKSDENLVPNKNPKKPKDIPNTNAQTAQVGGRFQRFNQVSLDLFGFNRTVPVGNDTPSSTLAPVGNDTPSLAPVGSGTPSSPIDLTETNNSGNGEDAATVTPSSVMAVPVTATVTSAIPISTTSVTPSTVSNSSHTEGNGLVSNSEKLANKSKKNKKDKKSKKKKKDKKKKDKKKNEEKTEIKGEKRNEEVEQSGSRNTVGSRSAVTINSPSSFAPPVPVSSLRPIENDEDWENAMIRMGVLPSTAEPRAGREGDLNSGVARGELHQDHRGVGRGELHQDHRGVGRGEHYEDHRGVGRGEHHQDHRGVGRGEHHQDHRRVGRGEHQDGGRGRGVLQDRGEHLMRGTGRRTVNPIWGTLRGNGREYQNQGVGRGEGFYQLNIGGTTTPVGAPRSNSRTNACVENFHAVAVPLDGAVSGDGSRDNETAVEKLQRTVQEMAKTIEILSVDRAREIREISTNFHVSGDRPREIPINFPKYKLITIWIHNPQMTVFVLAEIRDKFGFVYDGPDRKVKKENQPPNDEVFVLKVFPEHLVNDALFAVYNDTFMGVMLSAGIYRNHRPFNTPEVTYFTKSHNRQHHHRR